MYHTYSNQRLGQLLEFFPPSNYPEFHIPGTYYKEKLDRFLYTTGAFIMAKNGYKNWTADGQLRFVNIVLNEEDKAEFEDWLNEQAPGDFTHVFTLTHAGWKFSVAPDRVGKFYRASVQMINERSKDHNAYISAKASTASEATWLLLYKIIVVIGERPIPYANSDDNWG